MTSPQRNGLPPHPPQVPQTARAPTVGANIYSISTATTARRPATGDAAAPRLFPSLAERPASTGGVAALPLLVSKKPSTPQVRSVASAEPKPSAPLLAATVPATSHSAKPAAATSSSHGHQHPLFQRSAHTKTKSPPPSTLSGGKNGARSPPSTAIDLDWIVAQSTPPNGAPNMSPKEASHHLDTAIHTPRGLIGALQQCRALLSLREDVSDVFTDFEVAEMQSLLNQLHRHVHPLGHHASGISKLSFESIMQRSNEQLPPALQPQHGEPSTTTQHSGAAPAHRHSNGGGDPDLESPPKTVQPITPGSAGRPAATAPHPRAQRLLLEDQEDSYATPHESHANTAVAVVDSSNTTLAIPSRQPTVLAVEHAAALVHALVESVGASPTLTAIAEVESVTKRFVRPCDVFIGIIDATAELVFPSLAAGPRVSSELRADSSAALTSHRAVASSSHVIFPLISRSTAVGVIVFQAPSSATIDIIEAHDPASSEVEIFGPASQPTTVRLNACLLGVATSFAANAVSVGARLDVDRAGNSAMHAIAGMSRGQLRGESDDDTVQQLMDRLRDVTEAEVAICFRRDSETGHLIAMQRGGRADMPPVSFSLAIDHSTLSHRGAGCAAVMAVLSGKPVHVTSSHDAAALNDVFDTMTGRKSRDIVAVPIRDDGNVVGAVMIVNRLPSAAKGSMIRHSFNSSDVEVVRAFAALVTFAAANIGDSLHSDGARRAKQLHAALKALRHDGSLDTPAATAAVVAAARQVLPRSDIHAAVYHVSRHVAEAPRLERYEPTSQVVSFDLGTTSIATHVAKSGIAQRFDARRAGGLFNSTIDLPTPYTTDVVSVVSVPLRGASGGVAGVLQLCVTSAPGFTLQDFATVEAFAEAAGAFLAFHAKSDALVSPSLSAAAFEKAMNRVQSIPKSHQYFKGIMTPKFNMFNIINHAPREEALDFAAKAAFLVIASTGLPYQLGCSDETLMRFILACRSHYIDTPYHNFFHVVDVCQTAVTFLYSENGAARYLRPIDCFTLLVTALAHDLDHTGMNNLFHTKTRTGLGVLTACVGSTSALEIHHATVAMDILGTPGFDVFEGVEDEDLKAEMRKIMVDCILLTDGARHGELFEKLKQLDYALPDHDQRVVLIASLMHAADVSNPAKPFDQCHAWALRVVEEFSRQGDAEKELGYTDVLPQFDRAHNRDLPRSQIGFISFMVLPYFEELVKNIHGMSFARDNIVKNKASWQKHADEQRSHGSRRASLVVAK